MEALRRGRDGDVEEELEPARLVDLRCGGGREEKALGAYTGAYTGAYAGAYAGSPRRGRPSGSEG